VKKTVHKCFFIRLEVHWVSKNLKENLEKEVSTQQYRKGEEVHSKAKKKSKPEGENHERINISWGSARIRPEKSFVAR